MATGPTTQPRMITVFLFVVSNPVSFIVVCARREDGVAPADQQLRGATHGRVRTGVELESAWGFTPLREFKSHRYRQLPAQISDESISTHLAFAW
jgi:hypothetical protein